MRGEPCLDIAATLCRQLIVDVSVKLVFGHGNIRVGHCRGLCPIPVEKYLSSNTSLSAISLGAAQAARHRERLSHEPGLAQAGTLRCRSARPESRQPRDS